MLFKFNKNYKIIIILLLLFPIIFIGILKFCITYLPGEMIGSIDGWLGFLGGYFGVLGAIGAIWWQKKLDTITTINGINLYANYIVNKLSSEDFENTYLSFLSIFITFDNFNITDILNIDNIKKEINIINSDIINSNLSIILSNKRLSILLELKENLNILNNYIELLIKNSPKEDMGISLHNSLMGHKNQNALDELKFFRNIILKINFYSKKIIKFKQFEEKEIIPKYDSLIKNIEKTFNKSDSSILEILNCYEKLVDEISFFLFLLNKDFYLGKTEYSNYFSLVLKSIFTLKKIFKNIEELKSAN